MTKVRIKDQDRRPEFSIAVVVAAAVLIWFTIVLWSVDLPDDPVQRDLPQVRATYVCDANHLFTDHLDVKSLPCAHPGCGQRAWPMWSYQCSKDGAFLVQLRYVVDDGPRIKAARQLGTTWQTVQETVDCSLCGRALVPDLSLRRIPSSAELPSAASPGGNR